MHVHSWIWTAPVPSRVPTPVPSFAPTRYGVWNEYRDYELDGCTIDDCKNH